MTPREPLADICVNCIYCSIDKDWNIYCEIYKAGIVPECGKENPNVQGYKLVPEELWPNVQGDKLVPEELWSKVAKYCDNDVLATEAVWNARININN